MRKLLYPLFTDRYRIIVFLLFVLLSATPLQASGPHDGAASWTRSWYDEFNGTEIDSSKWSEKYYPWGSNDLVGSDAASEGTYADSYLENGNLVLRCRDNPSYPDSGRPYTHGIVHSGYTKGRWKYGYLEIRAKYPAGNRVWPAFWMLGDGWPPEFDIAEYFGSDDRMHMGVYDYNSTWHSANVWGGAQDWHTYALEWGPGYAFWYRDGIRKHSVYSSALPSETMYVLLNSGMRDLSSTQSLPNYYYIDYFRKYDPPSAVINDATLGTGLNQCHYVGTWTTVTNDSRLFFGDRHDSSEVDAYVEVPFNGTRVDAYCWKSPTQGIAGYSIDGGPEEFVDHYSGDYAIKLAWSGTGLQPGLHTLKIRVPGTKNADSSNITLILDRIDVWTAPVCLKGALIGTSGSYHDYGNTKDHVFDGNLGTYFDAPTADGWAGYDFGGETYRITQVRYCPRNGYPARMVGGTFQGANSPDFSDALDLFTITETPLEGVMTEQVISETTDFRYVRYLAPAGGYGNVSEVEFYGVNSSLLSEGQPVSASSYEAGNIPGNGNDGDITSTRWAAVDGSYPQWWRVDLGSVQLIHKAVIYWYNADSRSYQYRIEISDDDVHYTTVVDQTGRTEMGNSEDVFTASARYVRVTITGSSAGWASFWECKVFGPSGESPSFDTEPISEIDAIESFVYRSTLADDAGDPDPTDTLTFSKDTGPDWLLVAPDGTLSGIPGDSDVGENTFTVRVTDTEGLSDTATMTIQVANVYSGTQGLRDLAGFAAQWLESGCVDTPPCNGADLTGDQNVDMIDLKILSENWLFH